MASDPISLLWYPVTAGKVFEYTYADQSGGEIPGLGVMASLNGDAIWRGAALLPNTLPSGTGKLGLWARANATTGNARVNPKWVCVADGADFGSASVVAETVQSISWSSGDANDMKLTKITLDASTLTAGTWIRMDLTFENTSWTLAAKSWWWPVIFWE